MTKKTPTKAEEPHLRLVTDPYRAPTAPDKLSPRPKQHRPTTLMSRIFELEYRVENLEHELREVNHRHDRLLAVCALAGGLFMVGAMLQHMWPLH